MKCLPLFFLLLAALFPTYRAQGCSANLLASVGNQWVQPDGNLGVLLYFSVQNTGSCSITAAALDLYIPHFVTVTQSWGITQLGPHYFTLTLYNPINLGATATGEWGAVVTIPPNFPIFSSIPLFPTCNAPCGSGSAPTAPPTGSSCPFSVSQNLRQSYLVGGSTMDYLYDVTITNLGSTTTSHLPLFTVHSDSGIALKFEQSWGLVFYGNTPSTNEVLGAQPGAGTTLVPGGSYTGGGYIVANTTTHIISVAC